MKEKISCYHIFVELERQFNMAFDIPICKIMYEHKN
jgi:hypothetical protein